MGNKNHPPRFAERFLRWFCRPELLPEIEGDLQEIFRRRAAEAGIRKAQWLYIWHVLSFFRPFAIYKRTNFYAITNFRMWSHYLPTAYRNISKHKAYTLINIVGLSVGLTASLFIGLYILHELSYDRHHAKAERIYRVETQKIEADGSSTYPGTPLGVASALRQDFSAVEDVVTISLHRNQSMELPGKTTQAVFRESVAFADESLFSIFDYHWLAGHEKTALAEPNTVLLTEKYARKFFGYTSREEVSEAVGKIILLNQNLPLRVTGILEDYITPSSFPFDIIASLPTLKNMDPGFDPNEWGKWSDNNQTYVVLAAGTHPHAVVSQFPAMLEKYKGAGAAQERAHLLTPLKELHFRYNFGGRQRDQATLYTIGAIALFLLVIASINFINLTTAQATKRAKEVGVRKVLGSSRSQLAAQFMSETVLVTGLAFLLSVALLILLLPYASRLMQVELSVAALLRLDYIGMILGVFIVVSLLSGLYPAWVLSGFRPVTALKTKMNQRQTSRGFTLRQAMVTLQFAISQVLVIGLIVVASQMHSIRHADLGFDSDAMITMELPEHSPEKLERMRNLLLQTPGIKDLSYSFNSASAETNFMGELVYKNIDKEISIHTQFKLADTHFLNTYGIQLLAGEALHESDTTGQVLVNEVFVRKMGLQRPEEALGAFIDNSDPRFTIKGVVRDFHVNSLHQTIDPTVVVISPKHYRQIAIKTETLEASHQGQSFAGLQTILQQVRNAWTATFPDQVFSYQFLDDTLAQAYEKENQAMQLLYIFAGIAIFISCLGLYGLVSFMVAQRTKEIGIRKVLGASVGQVVQLFSREYMGLVVLAFLLAVPLGYYAMQQWLQDFAYRIATSFWMYGMAGASALLLAMLTVGIQTLRAATANPVESLRIE